MHACPSSLVVTLFEDDVEECVAPEDKVEEASVPKDEIEDETVPEALKP
jgi:hypothetical protein